MRHLLRLLLASGAALAAGAAAPGQERAKADHTNLGWSVTYDVHADLTYRETWQEDWSLDTARGVAVLSQPAYSFWPDSQTLTVEEAWVTQPDGTRLDVPPGNIFTRPSQAAQNAPGFDTSQTISILYPQLTLGSRWHVKLQREQTRPPVVGFNVLMAPVLGSASGPISVDITAPESVPLAFATRGEFSATETRAAGVRHIVGHMDARRSAPNERNMVAPTDVQPLFVATTMPSLEALGAIYHRQSAARAVVTPEITALAARIRGPKTGLDAARAISDWVAGHIRYVAVYLTPEDGYVPHPAAEVLNSGFGDCKDHVALMQALLTASDIRSEGAIVDWGTRYRPLPLPLPGQFNHAMVYLPDYGVFSNPTSPFNQFGALDAGLRGKTVVIASETGEVAKTAEGAAADNRYQRTSTIELLPDGTMAGESHITASGAVETGIRRVIAGAASRDDLVEADLAQTPEGGQGRLTSSDPHDLETPIDVQATWTSPHAVQLPQGQGQDADVFLTVPIGFDMEQPTVLRQNLAHRPTRRFPMVVGAKNLTWITRLILPSTLGVKRLPPDRTIQNPAGVISVHYETTEAGLTVTRHLTLARDITPPDEYPALLTLIYSAAEDARGVVVLSPRSATPL